MAQYGVAATVSFEAIDTSTGDRKTGNAANITCELSHNGAKCVAATNAAVEILHADNSPSGRYALTLTANERRNNHTRVIAESSTLGVVCSDVPILSDQLRGTNMITITVLTPGGTPVAGMSVAIFNGGLTDVIALCVTDASGIARIQGTTSTPFLDNGVVAIVCSLPFYAVSNPYYLTVDGAETVAITATPTDPSLDDANYQAITGTALRLNGDPYVYGKVKVRTDQKEQTVDGVSISGLTCEFDIAADGSFVAVAQRGAAVIAEILDEGEVVQQKAFTVTAAATATWDSY